MHPLLADAWVAAQIDAAVAPYRDIWPAEAVAAFREEMALTLATHPAARRLLAEARPQQVEPSGEMPTAGNLTAEDFSTPVADWPRKSGAK